MPIRSALVALMLVAAAAEAQTAAPLSAIDWLSDSIAMPVAVPRTGASGTLAGEEPAVVETARPDPVTVTPLDAPTPDTIGLYPPAQVGLPDALWRGSGMARVRSLLAAERELHLPAAQRLLRDMLEVATPPPSGSDGSEMFLARVDALLALGALDAARGLLDRADRETPEHFRRWFDIALLTGRENRACERMRALPRITPTYPARIFCLARGGDWMAAALTLDTAEALDVVSAAETERLNRFLDDLDESGLGLPPPDGPSPLDFAIYEAVGEPLGTATLPLAFAHADLRDNTGWKARIDAAERLARAGAIGADRLWVIYHEREPAASGGLWDRLAAIQAVDAAIVERDTEAVDATLPAAWAAMRSAGLGHLLAARHGAVVSGMDLPATARKIAFRMGLLAQGRPAAANAPSAPGDRFLGDVSRRSPRTDRATTPMEHAVAEGFSQPPPGRVRALLDGGRIGEALLVAVDRLEEGAAGNLDAVRDGLAILRAADQGARAMDAALELLLLERRT